MPPIPGFLLSWARTVCLLNDSVVEKMQQHGVTGAGISLDSVQPTNHDRFRGMEGAWKATMNGVEALKRAQLDFLIQTSVTQWNYDENPEDCRVRVSTRCEGAESLFSRANRKR